MDIVSLAKNIGIVLATATTLTYISGYMALRARAHTLGTDPAFTLVDEGYVFAGVRFVFLTLIILLLTSPVILFVRHGMARIQELYSGPVINYGQWLLLGILAYCTLYLLVKILGANSVLLQQKNSEVSVFVQKAVMGGGWAVMFIFLATLLTALSVLWLKARLSLASDPMTWVLSIVVVIQMFLLPIVHGALYADRKVRVLGARPDTVKDMELPIGIVDRTSEHVTLLGLNKGKVRSMVTIKLEDMNGVPIKEIVGLNEFLGNDLSQHTEEGTTAMSSNQQTADDASHDKTESPLARLIKSLQITFESIGSLGDSVVDSGQIWSVELDAAGEPGEAQKTGSENDLAWPVFSPDDQTVYAIRNGRLVQLDHDGQLLNTVDSDKQWTKLIGVTEQGSVLGVVDEDGNHMPAYLDTDGEIRVLSDTVSKQERKQRLMLMQENRSYTGSKSLFVDRSARGGRGFDVYYNTGDKVVNLSNCGDDRCGQPSLSPDGKRVLYVRKPRY